MTAFSLPGLPAELAWHNEPVSADVAGGVLVAEAGPRTDLFVDPGGKTAIDNAPLALLTPADEAFLLSAKVGVEFAAAFDAGALILRVGPRNWAKLAFEVSPQLQPMVVSVVTREVSDDCNGIVVDAGYVHLRLAVSPRRIAFHSSLDGVWWDLVRHFALGDRGSGMQLGFAVQSPTGAGCRATFSEVAYHAGELAELRDGS